MHRTIDYWQLWTIEGKTFQIGLGCLQKVSLMGDLEHPAVQRSESQFPNDPNCDVCSRSREVQGPNQSGSQHFQWRRRTATAAKIRSCFTMDTVIRAKIKPHRKHKFTAIFLPAKQFWSHPVVESRNINTTPIGDKKIAERAVRRVKEGTSAMAVQSRIVENWWE